MNERAPSDRRSPRRTGRYAICSPPRSASDTLLGLVAGLVVPGWGKVTEVLCILHDSGLKTQPETPYPIDTAAPTFASSNRIGESAGHSNDTYVQSIKGLWFVTPPLKARGWLVAWLTGDKDPKVTSGISLINSPPSAALTYYWTVLIGFEIKHKSRGNSGCLVAAQRK